MTKPPRNGRRRLAVGIAVLMTVGAAMAVGARGPMAERVASERPEPLADAPIWQRTYRSGDLGGLRAGALGDSGELERVHVVSFVDAPLDAVVLDRRSLAAPVSRGCASEHWRRSSFVAPSGRMSVAENFPVTVGGAARADGDKVAQQVGIDHGSATRVEVTQEIEVRPYDRVDVRALPLEERWRYRLRDGGWGRGAPGDGVVTRVVGVCFAVFRSP